MLIRSVGGSEAAGVRLLLSVIQHAESTDALRGPWVSDSGERRLMDGRGDVWFVADDDASVQRVSVLPCSCACTEVTTYADGLEVQRAVRSLA